jgi:hypothetical protein
MKTRCFNKTADDYPRYGGRGITVCERWLKFENFRDDMYETYQKHVQEYGEKDTQIDRINNDGIYEQANCKWSTWIENQNNKTWKPKSEEHKNKIREALKKHWERKRNGEIE